MKASLKTKSTLLTAAVLVTSTLLATTSQAAVIGFTGANFAAATVDQGTLGPVTAPSGGATITSFSFVVSGLTIDADGTENDTVTVTVAVSGVDGANMGMNNVVVAGSDFRVGTTTGGGGQINATGDSVSFGEITVSGMSSGNLSYTSTANYTGFDVSRFDGVNETGFYQGNSTAATNFANVDNPGVFSLSGDDTTITIGHVLGAFTVRSVDFSVDVTAVTEIPEPASLGLLAVGGLCMLGRRKR